MSPSPDRHEHEGALALSDANCTSLSVRNILYVTDFSRSAERAAPFVRRLAASYGAHVSLLHVWSPAEVAVAQAGYIGDFAYDLTDASRIELERCARSHFPSMQVEFHSTGGDPCKCVGSAIRNRNLDLVVIGADRQSSVTRALLGCTLEKMLHETGVPVVSIGPKARTVLASRPTKLLVPIGANDAAAAIPTIAGKMSSEFGARLTLLALRKRSIDPQQLAREYRIDPALIDCDSATGDPCTAITHAACEHDADLIAMSLGERHPVLDHLRPSLAYRVIMAAYCPVLTTNVR